MPPPLTIGCELELMMISPEDSGQSGQTELCRALRDPYTVKCNHSGCTAGAHKIAFPARIAPARGDYVYDQWRVSTDYSLGLSPLEEVAMNDTIPGGVDPHTLELQSRILNFHGTTNLPLQAGVNPHGGPLSFSWRDDIKFILSRINERYNNPADRPDTRVIVNESCGLHVHIGRGGNNLSLKEVKGIIAIFTAFERLFDSVLTTPRIGGYPNRIPGIKSIAKPADDYDFYKSSFGSPRCLQEPPGHYCQPWSTTFLTTYERTLRDGFGRHGPRHYFETSSDQTLQHQRRIPTVLSWLHLLLAANSIDDLQGFFGWQDSKMHESVVNIEHLTDDIITYNKRQTIEIRCHQATLNREEMTAWIDTVGSIAEYCARVSTTELMELVTTNWANPSFTFADLVTAIGASPETQEFYRDKRLSPSYAAKRRQAASEREAKATQPSRWKSVIEANEDSIQKQMDHFSVSEKIRYKFELGAYGKMPKKYVEHVLGPTRIAHEGDSLILH